MEAVTIKVREGTPAAEIHKLVDMAIAVGNTKHIEIIIGSGVTSFNQAMFEQRNEYEIKISEIVSSFNNRKSDDENSWQPGNFNPHARPDGSVYGRD